MGAVPNFTKGYLRTFGQVWLKAFPRIFEQAEKEFHRVLLKVNVKEVDYEKKNIGSKGATGKCS